MNHNSAEEKKEIDLEFQNGEYEDIAVEEFPDDEDEFEDLSIN